MTDLKIYYLRRVKQGQLKIAIWAVLIFAAYSTIAWRINSAAPLAFCVATWIVLILFHLRFNLRYYRRLKIVDKPFPLAWIAILEKQSLFYKKLNSDEKTLFNQRVLFFLSEKKIEGIDTTVDDTTRLLVAASAIIPTFAFPFFEYPNIHEVLIYPNSFDTEFQTEPSGGNAQNIIGIVGDRYMNNSVVLSKPDLLNGFNGSGTTQNVGIHEFVHLLDKADGLVDGFPDVLLHNTYVMPWLQIIKKEMHKIESDRSDINPYGMTNNAEFLSVVSEYFFNNPHEFHQKHPELYEYLASVFHQQTDK
ncbi:MAG: M90 family metallopeptidase [Bacteroidales bacterium]|jgi:hypothetical protein